MKLIKKIIRQLYPFFFGILTFNILRAVTDLTLRDVFWTGDLRLHLISIFCSVSFCYLFDFLWCRRLNKAEFLSNKSKSIIKEYFLVFFELIFLLNISLLLGEYAGILFIGNGKMIDFMLINVSYVPLLMLYYTLIRNGIVNRNYQEKILQLEKLKVENYESELKFLKSQYHPHFLFNALNTIYFQVDEENKEAKRSIEQLSDLLRYQLYDIEKEVTLEQEIHYLKSYIAFQQLRMSERLVLDVYFDPDVEGRKIHPLLFQPLIENAFKHVKGEYKMKFALRRSGNQIHFSAENSIAVSCTDKIGGSGIGVENLKRRLDLLYPGRHSLEVKQTGKMFIVELTIEIE